MILGAGIVGVIGIVFVAQLIYDRDAQRAIERTSERVVGLMVGAGASFVAALVIGVEAVLSAPELLITVLGVGSIIGGINWPMYAALAFVVWILSMVVKDPRGGPS